VGIIVLLILLVIVIGITVLQIFLSTRENKGLGLILPAVAFAFSLLLLLGFVPFETHVVTDGITYEPSGGDIFMSIVGFMLSVNIPTMILLVIYAICRLVKKDKKDNENNKIQPGDQINKMNIQDLG